MVYGIKYKFRFDSANGVLYTVNLLKDGYSGDVTVRPLGKSPVIRMQEDGVFRATSCNLVLECQTDGEFAELYTSDPLKYRIDIFRGGTIGVAGTKIWSGFVATEIYSEPDIAPPYDVNITATDGLGVLKEYTFESRGLQKVREQIGFFLRKTGLDQGLYCAASMGPTSGTPVTLFDSVSINMDYMVGENCYDVFAELLRSFHLTVTSYGGKWLILRETDVAGKLNSSGALSVYDVPSRAGSSSSTTSTTLSDAKKTIGQMGATGIDLWPVGYLTRRVVPAKNEVTIEAPWHKGSVTPSIKDGAWTTDGPVTHYADPGYYKLGGKVNNVWHDGSIGAQFQFASFNNDLVVTVRFNRSPGTWGARPTATRRIRLGVSWIQGGVQYLYNDDDGWVQSTGEIYVDTIDVDRSYNNSAHDPALARDLSFSIPGYGTNSSGQLTVVIFGLGVDVYDATVELGLSNGYKDIIVIDNNARGKGGSYVITGGRALNGYVEATNFYNGLFVWTNYPETAVYDWADNRQYGVNFVSLAALDYALSFASSRIELSGRFDLPSELTLPPVVLDLRSVLYQIKTYDWDLKEDEVSFTAVSTPASSITVDSETVISIPNE